MKSSHRFWRYSILLWSLMVGSYSFAQAQEPCDGKPLPVECVNPCDPNSTCYTVVMSDHNVTPEDFKTKYIVDGLPFIYEDISNFIGLAGCTQQLYFAIAQKNNGKWYSVLTDEKPESADPLTRGFPLALFKAIDARYQGQIESYNFYWLTKSPQCPDGNDVLIDVVLTNGTHRRYDLSDPPTQVTFDELNTLFKNNPHAVRFSTPSKGTKPKSRNIKKNKKQFSGQ